MKMTGSNLKALYTGRYQHTKEQGVKRMAQRMARPRPTPLPEGSTQNMAREETTLKSSAAAQTEHRAGDDVTSARAPANPPSIQIRTWLM